jgi:hypothetical protein
MQEPTERVLGRHMCEKNGRSIEVIECCYDISLIDSLQRLLCMDAVREQVPYTRKLYWYNMYRCPLHILIR